MKRSIIITLLCLVGFTALASNQDSTYIISKDTVKVSGITLTTYTSKSGKEYSKAVYMGKKYSISKKDIDTFDPNKTWIIFNQYNNGERKISKVIVK